MSAADVIKSWSDEVGADGLMFGAVSAIQPGNPALGSGNVVAYTSLGLRQSVGGNLEDPEAFLMFSDRTRFIEEKNIQQPFDVYQIQNAMITLTVEGQLQIKNPWGTTDVVDLTDVGNNILTGWGPSIGNKEVPSMWSVTADRQLHN